MGQGKPRKKSIRRSRDISGSDRSLWHGGSKVESGNIEAAGGDGANSEFPNTLEGQMWMDGKRFIGQQFEHCVG